MRSAAAQVFFSQNALLTMGDNIDASLLCQTWGLHVSLARVISLAVLYRAVMIPSFKMIL